MESSKIIVINFISVERDAGENRLHFFSSRSRASSMGLPGVLLEGRIKEINVSAALL
jgi:hypothetical protein